MTLLQSFFIGALLVLAFGWLMDLASCLHRDACKRMIFDKAFLAIGIILALVSRGRL
jgi:hypothetical protein